MTACVVYLISVCKAKCILLFAAVTPPTSPVPHLTLSTHAATVDKCEAHAAHLELSHAYFASFHSPFAVFSTSVGGCMLLYYHSNYCM